MQRLRVLAVLAAGVAVLSLAAPAEATTPTVKVTYKSASWGIVNGNTVWSAKAITVKASSTGAASTDRYVVQALYSGSWHTQSTKQLARTSSSVSVTFYPRWGTKSYRLALVRSTGTLRAKTTSWTSQGFKTVPIQRVTKDPLPSTGQTLTAYGYTVPAMWATSSAVMQGQQSAAVGGGLCRRYMAVADIESSGAPDSDGVAQLAAGYEQEPLHWVLNEPVARAATDPLVQGTAPRASRFTPVYPSGGASFTWIVVGTSGGSSSAQWNGGIAKAGAAGLCAKTLR